MDWAAECVAIVPCFNEQRTIADLTKALRARFDIVVVVDDGSTDSSAVRATEAGATVLRHEVNRGKGAALQTGWRWAHARNFKWTLCLDADGQHSPEDVPTFFRCAERSAAALVIGNRMAAPWGMPWLRRLVNRWMSRRISRVAGQPLPDSQCGFRLMNLEAWAALSITSSRFEIESEVLWAFVTAKYRVEFVPIRVIYTEQQSKIHPVRDTIRWFKWWRRIHKTSRQ